MAVLDRQADAVVSSVEGMVRKFHDATRHAVQATELRILEFSIECFQMTADYSN